MQKKFLVILFLFFLLPIFLDAQKNYTGRIVFYNLENLFDIEDDPETTDEEFLPEGERYWDSFKYNRKIINVAKVITGIGEWQFPAVIGFCEIENRKVLEKLVSSNPLKDVPYSIIHKESPDIRGIDVAVLYRKDLVNPLGYEYLEVKNEKNNSMYTRDILYFFGVISNIDTVHFFFNHWPSRYNGVLETADKRMQAAKTLRKKIDDLLVKFKNPSIVIMGDFNDQPIDNSLVYGLMANNDLGSIEYESLYNISVNWMGEEIGTIKYQSQWLIYDQIILSGSLIEAKKKLYCNPDSSGIYQISFLLEEDERYGGIRPNRTYIGYTYHGGFSDHLPVFIDIFSN